MIRFFVYLLYATLIGGCSTIEGKPRIFTGEVTSAFEHFGFVPCEPKEMFWIRSESWKAKNWDRLDDALEASKLKNPNPADGPFPRSSATVTAKAKTKSYKNGTGHLSGYDKDILFLEIISAVPGKNCPVGQGNEP